jgi:hypothetical protein
MCEVVLQYVSIEFLVERDPYEPPNTICSHHHLKNLIEVSMGQE